MQVTRDVMIYTRRHDIRKRWRCPAKHAQPHTLAVAWRNRNRQGFILIFTHDRIQTSIFTCKYANEHLRGGDQPAYAHIPPDWP